MTEPQSPKLRQQRTIQSGYKNYNTYIRTVHTRTDHLLLSVESFHKEFLNNNFFFYLNPPKTSCVSQIRHRERLKVRRTGRAFISNYGVDWALGDIKCNKKTE